MSQIVRDHLLALIAQDPSIGDDARRCEALLRDLCRNEHRREITALVTAIRERVVAEIRTEATGVGPSQALMARLWQRLHDDCGLREDLSLWTIQTWATAYGVPVATSQPTPATSRSESDSSQHAAPLAFLHSQSTYAVERHVDEFENHTTLTIPSGRIQWYSSKPHPEVVVRLELRAFIDPNGTLIEGCGQCATPETYDVGARMILLCDREELSFPFRRDIEAGDIDIDRSRNRRAMGRWGSSTITGWQGVFDFRGGNDWVEADDRDRALCRTHLEVICRANVVKIRFLLPPDYQTEPDEEFCRKFQALCRALYRATYVD